MTLPQNVKNAVAQLDNAMMFHADDLSYASWTAIRAHLLSQDAEIADLIGKRDFLLRHYNIAESRLAAANALLREAIEWNWLDEDSPAIAGVNKDIPSAMDAIYTAIKSHLQGAGDE